MIKINLLKSFNVLDSEALKSLEEEKAVKIELAKRIVVFLLGPISLFGYESILIPELQGELTAIQNETAQLAQFNLQKEAIAKEIVKYEEDKKKLNTQMNYLEKITREKQFAKDFLKFIQDNTPTGLWLTSLSAVGNRIELKGQSDSDIAINSFESILKSLNVITNVKLLDINIVEQSKTGLYQKNQIVIRDFLIRAEFNFGTEDEVK